MVNCALPKHESIIVNSSPPGTRLPGYATDSWTGLVPWLLREFLDISLSAFQLHRSRTPEQTDKEPLWASVRLTKSNGVAHCLHLAVWPLVGVKLPSEGSCFTFVSAVSYLNCPSGSQSTLRVADSLKCLSRFRFIIGFASAERLLPTGDSTFTHYPLPLALVCVSSLSGSKWHHAQIFDHSLKLFLIAFVDTEFGMLPRNSQCAVSLAGTGTFL
jgi:hypothetical protein